MPVQRPEAWLAEARATIRARFFPAVVGPSRHCGAATTPFLWLRWMHRFGGAWCGRGGHRAAPEISGACVHIGEQFVFVRIEGGAVDVDVEINPVLFAGECVPIVFAVNGEPVTWFDAAGVVTVHAAQPTPLGGTCGNRPAICPRR